MREGQRHPLASAPWRLQDALPGAGRARAPPPEGRNALLRRYGRSCGPFWSGTGRAVHDHLASADYNVAQTSVLVEVLLERLARKAGAAPITVPNRAMSQPECGRA